MEQCLSVKCSEVSVEVNESEDAHQLLSSGYFSVRQTDTDVSKKRAVVCIRDETVRRV